MRQLREHIVYHVKAIMTQCFLSKNKYTFYIFARMCVYVYIYVYIYNYTEYRTFNNACSFRYVIQDVLWRVLLIELIKDLWYIEN